MRENLAARLDTKGRQAGSIEVFRFGQDSYLKMCFFQYMIANVDWSVANKHNLEITRRTGFDIG